MKHFFKFLFFSSLLFSLISCSSYKSKLQTTAITFPELGSLIKTKGDLWYASSEQVGVLNFEKPILVTAQELPFSKATYKKYASYLEKANRINNIVYTDSMPYKPKYIRLHLLDKIRLTSLLNSDTNSAVRSYLEIDPDYKLVTSIAFSVPDALRISLMEAEGILIQNDEANKLSVVLKKGQQRQVLDFSQVEVFEYSYVSFCWGEDAYHTKVIKALVQDNEGCPNATYAKAAKVKSNTPSYLKL